jgi:hypothetical protein
LRWLADDAKKLFKDYGVMMANVVELGSLARQADPACTDPNIWGGGKRIVSLAKVLPPRIEASFLTFS